jgi:hypothetical protein
MQTDPPKADPPKRKRRWSQFSLRTLMLFVTLACVIAGWIGWRLYIERLDDEIRGPALVDPL